MPGDNWNIEMLFFNNCVLFKFPFFVLSDALYNFHSENATTIIVSCE